MPERLVAFEACFNFRDLGGYPTVDGRTVRWGRLYRADTLHRLTDADLDRFRSLGLRTVIDLRGASEIEDHGRLRDDIGGELAWHNLSMLDDVVLRPSDDGEPPRPPEVEPGESYLNMVGPGLAAAFELLGGHDRLPAVFHCTSGKDRTGVVAALTLDVLGVDDDVIADDYALTMHAMARAEAWIAEHEPDFAAYIAQLDPVRRMPRPERILGFLSLIRDRHGSAAGLLASLGLAPTTIERLRDELLDD